MGPAPTDREVLPQTAIELLNAAVLTSLPLSGDQISLGIPTAHMICLTPQHHTNSHSCRRGALGEIPGDQCTNLRRQTALLGTPERLLVALFLTGFLR